MNPDNEEWERRRLVCREIRRLADRMEEICEDDDGENDDRMDRVWRRQWDSLHTLINSFEMEEPMKVIRKSFRFTPSELTTIRKALSQFSESHHPDSETRQEIKKIIDIITA